MVEKEGRWRWEAGRQGTEARERGREVLDGSVWEASPPIKWRNISRRWTFYTTVLEDMTGGLKLIPTEGALLLFHLDDQWTSEVVLRPREDLFLSLSLSLSPAHRDHLENGQGGGDGRQLPHQVGGLALSCTLGEIIEKEQYCTYQHY
jgi:hypothetical protein